MRILAAEGLAELSPNRGARVPDLELEEVDTYYRMRERLEPLTLIESLRHLSDEQIDRLESLREALEGNTDAGRFMALDREFHLSSYAACASEQLVTATVRLWNSTQHYRRALMSSRTPIRPRS